MVKSITAEQCAEYKFGCINIGATVKAYDFPPMEGRDDMYIEGLVTARVEVNGAFCYELAVTNSDDFRKIGSTSYVPMEVSMMEYDERIEVIKG